MEFVSTKEGLGRTAAICYAPSRTEKLIRTGASKAARNYRNGLLKPYFVSPMILEIETHRREDTEKALQVGGITQTGERSFSYTHDNAAECFAHIWKALAHSMEETPAWLQ
jgi:D-aminopeptidase